MDEKWEGAVTRCKQIRKPIHDFPPEGWSGEEESNYQGAVPYFTPIGVYGKIFFFDMAGRKIGGGMGKHIRG